MTLIDYINDKVGDIKYQRLTDLTPEQYRYYISLRNEEYHKPKVVKISLTKEDKKQQRLEYHAIRRQKLKAEEIAKLKEFQLTKDELDRIKKESSEKWKAKREYNSKFSPKERKYMARANAKGIEYSLTSDHFNTLMCSSCVYCNSIDQMTIDRIDSNKGYTINNVQPCCHICNTMKWVLPNNDFIYHIKKIISHLDG